MQAPNYNKINYLHCPIKIDKQINFCNAPIKEQTQSIFLIPESIKIF